MLSKLKIVVALLILSRFVYAETKKAPAPSPKLNVDARYKHRKDFKDFEDLLPESKRTQEIKDESKETIASVTIGHRVLSIGSVKVTDGKIAVFDGATISGGVLAKSVSKGEFRVLLAARVYQEQPDAEGDARPPYEVIQLARVNFTKQKVARWELAVFENEKTSFPVDSGTAAISNGKHYDAWKRKMSPEVNHEIMGRIQKSLGVLTYRDFVQVTHGNATMVRWGGFGGDGSFSCYWGYDKDDDVASLVIDFHGMLSKLIDEK